MHVNRHVCMYEYTSMSIRVYFICKYVNIELTRVDETGEDASGSGISI